MDWYATLLESFPWRVESKLTLLLSMLILVHPMYQGPQPDVRAQRSPAMPGEAVQAWDATARAWGVCVCPGVMRALGSMRGLEVCALWGRSHRDGGGESAAGVPVYKECEFPHTNFDSFVQKRKILITTFASAERLVFTKRTLRNRLNNGHFSPCCSRLQSSL